MRIKWLIVFVLICTSCPAPESLHGEGDPLHMDTENALLFYNVENLFHPSDDSIPGDDPFTPVGARYWTFWKYKRKINSICKVILAATGWEPPVFIGLCEIENEKVLKDLVFHPLLINYHYKYIHQDSPDHRGIDVALLYKADRVRCLSQKFIHNDLPGRTAGTREILYGEFCTATDSVQIFVNHWTSKYGGTYETEALRLHQANLLYESVDTLLRNNASRRVLITGDFNDNSFSRSVQHLCRNGLIKEVSPGEGNCTYKYRGKWDLIDHVFIAGAWSDRTYRAEVFKRAYLLEEDVNYTGEKPFRTYSGYSYNGGISDHLPIIFYFDLKAEQADSPASDQVPCPFPA